MSYLIARPQWKKVKEYLETGLPNDHWLLDSPIIIPGIGEDPKPRIEGPIFLDYESGTATHRLDEEIDDEDVRYHARFIRGNGQ